MKISKSKRQLARLIVEAGVRRFPRRAGWAAQDADDGLIFFYKSKPVRESGNDFWSDGVEIIDQISTTDDVVIQGWHQTALSRAEFDQIVAESAEQVKPDADGWIEWKGGECPVDEERLVIIKVRGETGTARGKAGRLSWGHSGDDYDIIAYRLHKPERAEPQLCESVTLTIPEPVTTPTLDQLLQDYRNAADFSAAKQAEADEAAKMRDERWKEVQARACELGVRISVELVVDAEISEPEPVITDWRDVKPGDIVWIGDRVDDPDCDGAEYEVERIDERDQEQPFKLNGGLWPMINRRGWRFIRRP